MFYEISCKKFPHMLVGLAKKVPKYIGHALGRAGWNSLA